MAYIFIPNEVLNNFEYSLFTIPMKPKYGDLKKRSPKADCHLVASWILRFNSRILVLISSLFDRKLTLYGQNYLSSTRGESFSWKTLIHYSYLLPGCYAMVWNMFFDKVAYFIAKGAFSVSFIPLLIKGQNLLGAEFFVLVPNLPNIKILFFKSSFMTQWCYPAHDK